MKTGCSSLPSSNSSLVPLLIASVVIGSASANAASLAKSQKDLGARIEAVRKFLPVPSDSANPADAVIPMQGGDFPNFRNTPTFRNTPFRNSGPTGGGGGGPTFPNFPNFRNF